MYLVVGGTHWLQHGEGDVLAASWPGRRRVGAGRTGTQPGEEGVWELAGAAPFEEEEPGRVGGGVVGTDAGGMEQVDAAAKLAVLEDGLAGFAVLEEDVAALAAVDDGLAALAAVEDGLAALAVLEGGLAGFAVLEEGLAALAVLEEGLAALAVLEDGLASLAVLEEGLAALAVLEEGLAALAVLEDGLASLAVLEEGLAAVEGWLAVAQWLAEELKAPAWGRDGGAGELGGRGLAGLLQDDAVAVAMCLVQPAVMGILPRQASSA